MNCDKDLGTRETSHINPMVPVSFKEGIPADFTWFCEPKKHDIREDKLIIVPDSGSDFWQRTHYGFRNNNGHCLWTGRKGDFVLTTHVRYNPQHQFDQAGLVVYFTEDFWIKCSVEHEPEGAYNLGSVVTNLGYSDWATQPYFKTTVDMEFMIKHVKQDFEIYCREYGEERWRQMRITRLELPVNTVFHVGVYACSPKEGGFEAVFESLSIDNLVVNSNTLFTLDVYSHFRFISFVMESNRAYPLELEIISFSRFSSIAATHR